MLEHLGKLIEKQRGDGIPAIRVAFDFFGTALDGGAFPGKDWCSGTFILDDPNRGFFAGKDVGGVGIEAIRAMPGACATVQLGASLAHRPLTAAGVLEKSLGVKAVTLPLPVGIRATDRFLDVLAEISGQSVPAELLAERGRLVDSMVDAHKIVFGKRAVVFGEADLVVGLVALLCEMGIEPVLWACGGRTGHFVNDLHIPEISRVTQALGATIMNCIPLCPVEDTAFENLHEPDGLMMARVRLLSGQNLSQMTHCARCRADAVGLIGQDQSLE